MKHMAKNTTDVRRRKILLSEVDMALLMWFLKKALSVVCGER